MDGDSVSLSIRLQDATTELHEVEALLASGDLDAGILADFRDAVNRVRTAAWATQQYAESKDTDRDPTKVLSVLAGERVRATYQLCRSVCQDLDRPDLRFQPGQLLQLQTAVQELSQRLKTVIGNGR
jgi:hypothetical protein